VRVVVVGGGVAGLETLLALRDLAGDRVDLTLVAPEPEFVYRPLTVEEPFSHQPAERRELAPVAEELGAELVVGALASVDPAGHQLELADGTRLDYERLVVCVGGRPRPAFAAATTFFGGAPSEVEELLDRADEGQRIAFVVPHGASWALPIYELALMSRSRLEETGKEGVRLVVATPEDAPLILFGTAASEAVSAVLAARGIEVEAGVRLRESDGGLVAVPGNRPLEADAVVALPVIEGPRIDGLPADEAGFLPIDEHARVKGVEGVYAAGDGTNFPVKQGGIGTQQADAAAEQIAAAAGAGLDPEPFHPVLRGQLITGVESLNLRQDLGGGAGEGAASLDYLWWPPQKIAGRYLSAWLARETPHADLEPPELPLDVEVAFPHEWHAEPMALDPYSAPD
jgi:sulfide:quinone oxidoreductase